jgi:hypothetical protein
VSGVRVSRSFGADIQVGRRGVRWPFGRFVISDEELTVRSSPTRWIRVRSASREAVGEISVTSAPKSAFLSFAGVGVTT